MSGALDRTSTASENQYAELEALRIRLNKVDTALTGDKTLRSRNEPAPLSITARVYGIRDDSWESQSKVTGLHRDSYAIAEREFTRTLDELRKLTTAVGALENQLENQGAPWTPGRLPGWTESERSTVR